MTPGVPIAHASIQALTHSCIIGGNILVFIAVTKKLTMPVMTVATKIPPIMVPTVYPVSYTHLTLPTTVIV